MLRAAAAINRTVVVVFIFLAHVWQVNAGDLPSVLVIHSYDKDFTWTKTCREGLLASLGQKYRINELFLNTKSQHLIQIERTMSNALTTVKKINPDIVVLGDDNALKYLGQQIIDSGVPVVFMGINNNPRLYFRGGRLPTMLSGVLERPMLGPWLRYIRLLLPDASRGVYLFDGSYSADSHINVFFKSQSKIKHGNITGNYFNSSDWKEWQTFVLNLKKNNYQFAVLVTNFTVRDGERIVGYDEINRWLSQHSPVPIFGTHQWEVSNNGLIGALAINGFNHGQAAGELAIKMLNRSKFEMKWGGGLIKMDTAGTFFFNQSGLNKWNIILPVAVERELSATSWQ